MSRLTLCVVTAAALAAVSVAVMAVRHEVMGDEVAAPSGPGTYQVTLLVRGRASGDARLTTACPLDVQRQHVFDEEFLSDVLAARPLEAQHPDRRQVQWAPRRREARTFEARYQFSCKVNVHHPSAAMTRLGQELYAPPRTGEHTRSEPRVEASAPAVSEQALLLTAGLTGPADQARAFFQYVGEEVGSEPAAGGPGLSALECLKAGRGDAAAKSRLLVALCRNRGIPARLVTGLTLARRGEQQAHVWAEAWVGDHWMPLCPFHRHCGRVPATYLVFGFGEVPLVRGHNVRGLSYACLAQHKPYAGGADAEAPSALRRAFERLSLWALPPTEMGLVEFLLLLPVAALVICVYRNVIGLGSFGTFAPALIGLSFRRLDSLPGLLVLVSIILVGWGLRRGLNRYHLLQVPRSAFLLSLVVVLLLGAMVAANVYGVSPTSYFSLFPLVILVGMIERFWTLETEDGTFSPFRTLLGTMVIAGTISLVASGQAVVVHLFRYPETVGVVMAAQLLIGRYTGYRLSELLRFRDFVRAVPGAVPAVRHKRVSIPIAAFDRAAPQGQ